uniref:Uncharacterized protein n=2 Tax=Odontella aurita TaxID=265563 RepID=A0A7S4N750_9STRA|mmetsp:Transcript_50136/g.150929  ORF Transcript_50136/g.150929 Transcript_50136/m.150929 type:complete len:288 (+) Transcript_50136:847-1710(+)
MDDDRRVKGARSRSDGKYRRCDSCRGGACSCLPSPDDFLGGVPSSICFSSNFLEEEEEEQRRRQHQRGRDVEEEVVEDKEEAIPSNSDDVSLAGAAVDWSSVGAEGDGGSSSSSSSSLLEWEEIEARGSGGAAPGSAFPQWREDVGDDGKEDHIAALTGLAGPAGGSFRTPPPPEFRKNAPRDYDGRTEGDGGGGNDGAAKARSRSATPETIPDTPSSTRPTVAGTGTGARGEGDAPAGRRRIDFDEEERRGPADGGAGETKSMVKKKKGRKGHGLNRILKSLRRGG